MPFVIHVNLLNKDSFGTQLSSADDSSTSVYLAFTFNYFGTSFTQLTISTNGYVCLGYSSQCSSTVKPNGSDIIVGLNHDLNTAKTGSGQIYYKTLSVNSNEFSVVQSYVNLLNSSFIPTDAFMITYDRVLPYSSSSSSLTSFQIFISINSIKSYVTLKYTSCPTDLSVRATSGLNHHYGGSWIEEPTFTNWCTSSNVGQIGVWVFDVSS